MLRTLGIAGEKEFFTYPYLGNIGTVSLPITAALAEDREFLRPGDRVAFLGIGSGLNCLMLGLEWGGGVRRWGSVEDPEGPDEPCVRGVREGASGARPGSRRA